MLTPPASSAGSPSYLTRKAAKTFVRRQPLPLLIFTAPHASIQESNSMSRIT